MQNAAVHLYNNHPRMTGHDVEAAAEALAYMIDSEDASVLKTELLADPEVVAQYAKLDGTGTRGQGHASPHFGEPGMSCIPWGNAASCHTHVTLTPLAVCAAPLPCPAADAFLAALAGEYATRRKIRPLLDFVAACGRKL